MSALFMPRNGHGLANLFIMLTDFFHHYPDGVVHESIKNFEMGRWLTFNFPITDRTDITPVCHGNIYINDYTIQHVHSKISTLVRPSPELEEMLSRFDFMDNVRLGIHLRRGASAKDSRAGVETDQNVYATDEAVLRMVEIANNVGPEHVFLASDSPDSKKFFDSKINTLDAGIGVVHDTVLKGQKQDHLSIFLDFFLLSKCQDIIVTGGNYPSHPGLSTFGYMAALYGKKNFTVMKN
jgi:hypothetical protein